MQAWIDKDILPGLASVIIKDNHVVDVSLLGCADIESHRPMQLDTIFRIYSNTKIITSVAALCLLEDGCFRLDDAIETWLPEFAHLSVLKEGATSPDDVVPAMYRPTVRQLMCHNAGFSYGLFQESPVDQLYTERNVMDPFGTLESMVDTLATIPLAYQPGKRWQYSVSTDILARLIEIWSGESFAAFLKSRIFDPLDMIDTGFHVPEDKQHRFATNYVPENPLDPLAPGLKVAPDTLLGSYLKPKTFTSGGGGLVSTIADYTRFVRVLVGQGTFDGVTLLSPDTVALMQTPQLPAGVTVQLPTWPMTDTTFGLGVAIKTAPAEGEPDTATNEFHWGGMAGTHSFVSPDAGLAALVFTQRLPGFWHPFSHEFKRLAYAATS